MWSLISLTSLNAINTFYALLSWYACRRPPQEKERRCRQHFAFPTKGRKKLQEKEDVSITCTASTVTAPSPTVAATDATTSRALRNVMFPQINGAKTDQLGFPHMLYTVMHATV
jgi:hypothetical protein